MEEKTIAEIVSEDFRTAQVFRKYNLDFCCGGKRKLAEACERKGVDLSALLSDLKGLGSEAGDEDHHKYNEWSPDFLADYIINNHHHYVRTKLPEIKEYAMKTVKAHGKTYPVLNEMLEIFLLLKEEMLSHLDREEIILFPYIKKLVRALEDGHKPTVEQQMAATEMAIAMLEEEHEDAGRLMDILDELSDHFTPPEGACTTFRVYFQSLKAFRDDLHKHVHLENNILFPKALSMEAALN